MRGGRLTPQLRVLPTPPQSPQNASVRNMRRSELSSINDLDASHVELLQRLVREGARAIAAVHPGVAVEDLQVFTHFPPNIFRLHVHFVHTGVPMWAPDNEVVPVQTLVSEMRTRVRRSPPRITCASWN